jgi:hypothetical protein
MGESDGTVVSRTGERAEVVLTTIVCGCFALPLGSTKKEDQ